jgi:hypothetical protein
MNDNPKTNRFSAGSIWAAHMKGLQNRDFRAAAPHGVADLLARTVLYGIPVGLGVVSYVLGAKLTGVDGLLAASGILAGGLFMAFTQVAAWRDRYTERMLERHASELPQRYSLDETVAHILMATYGCLLLTVAAVAGSNFADHQERLTGFWAAGVIVLGSYVVLLLGIILPKLYAAYAVTHQVDPEMSGLYR